MLRLKLLIHLSKTDKKSILVAMAFSIFEVLVGLKRKKWKRKWKMKADYLDWKK